MSQFTPNEDTLQNYLYEKLSADECAKVELWLVENPEKLEELELDFIMKDGLEGVLENNQSKPKDWKTSKLLYVISILASLLFGILFSDRFSLKSNIKSQLVAPQVYMLSENNSEETKLKISNRESLVLQTPVDYPSNDLYSAQIIGSNGVQFSLDKLKPIDDLVSILIPKNLLASGLYQLKISNRTHQINHSKKFEIIN